VRFDLFKTLPFGFGHQKIKEDPGDDRYRAVPMRITSSP
jgi:hypothetical protein